MLVCGFGVPVCILAMRLGRARMYLCLFVLALIVVMGGFSMVMCGRLMLRCCSLVMCARRMFGGRSHLGIL
jgi:hypothetical protein